MIKTLSSLAALRRWLRKRLCISRTEIRGALPLRLSVPWARVLRAIAPRLHTALQLAVKIQRGCLVAVAPNFVAAWNRWHRRLGSDAWLATLQCRTLTVGLVGLRR